MAWIFCALASKSACTFVFDSMRLRASVSGADVNVVQHRRQIRQHEGVRIFRADEVASLFREVGFVAFLVNGEKQFLLFAVKVHLLLVLVQLQFGLIHHPGIFRILQKFRQTLRTRLAGFDAEQQQADFVFERGGVLHIRAVGGIQFFDQRLGLGQEPVAQTLLRAHERFDRRLPLRVLLVKGVQRRAADDERRARLINEDRVHFVHDGEVMAALDLFLLAQRPCRCRGDNRSRTRHWCRR